MILESVLSTFANHLWQTTLFAAVAWLLALSLGKNHAQARHWIWLTASVKFLIPFSLLAGIGNHIGSWTAPDATVPRLSIVMEQISQPFTPSVLGSASKAGAVRADPSAGVPLSALLLAVWLCGCAAILLSWRARWRRVTAAVRTALPIRDAREWEALRRCQRIAGQRGHIELLSSEESLEPGVFGIFRPVLLLPAGISDRLTDAQLDGIIAHELCHVRRRDNLVAAIHMVVEALYWFHPLVWWLGARLVDERERACDDEALRLGSERQAYAESILKACEFYLESPLACVAGVTGSDLRKRIERIMSDRISSKLDFGRKLLLSAVAAAAVAGPVAIGFLHTPLSRAQSPADATAAFEVASVKLNKSGDGHSRFNTKEGTLRSTNVSLRDFIRWAYRLKDYQISGPDWLSSQKYDIVAKADAPVKNDQLMAMLRTLLTDRFKLVVHHETKDRPVYALAVGKNGFKLHEVEAGPEHDSAGRDHLSGQKMSMAQLAIILSRLLDRPVLDVTGIQGVYDIELKWMPEDGDGPSIFTAVQAQLGLKLESRKGPIEILVVDHAEKVPSEN